MGDQHSALGLLLSVLFDTLRKSVLWDLEKQGIKNERRESARLWEKKLPATAALSALAAFSLMETFNK